MKDRKTIFAINGSASQNSSNEKLINNFARLTKEDFNVIVFNDLKALPHFDPELSVKHTPKAILELRENINRADGVLICSPEYVFSIPSGLKNVIEWCVSTTIFSGKLTGLITASANGQKGHEELQLIMKTVLAKFTNKTTLLIQGVKGKMNESGEIKDNKTLQDFKDFVESFKKQILILSLLPIYLFQILYK